MVESRTISNQQAPRQLIELSPRQAVMPPPPPLTPQNLLGNVPNSVPQQPVPQQVQQQNVPQSCAIPFGGSSLFSGFGLAPQQQQLPPQQQQPTPSASAASPAPPH
eukprot:2913427-Amphidinium_carterae.1